jgi:uncharacterized protein DUF1877
MGVDLRMCAVRLASEPMVQIRTDEAAWRSALDHPPFHWRSCGTPADVSQLLAEVPNALTLNWDYPDRSFHQLEYLLDPVGYHRLTSYEEREQTLPYRIIEGDQLFAWHARGGQGRPWRCSTNDFLTCALVFLDEFDPAAVRSEFSVAAMAARGIYKTHEDADDDATFAALLDRLGELTRYYERVWSHDLDMIVIKD